MAIGKFTVNTSAFSEAMGRLRGVLGKELGEQILKEEAAQLIKTVVRLDNKLAIQQSQFGTTGRSVRERAVENAIKRTMRPISSTDFDEPRAIRFVKYMEEHDEATRNLMLARIKSGPLRYTSSHGFSERFHRNNIHSATGKTARTGYLLFGKEEHAQLVEYMAKIKERVGWKFGGFNAAAEAVGLTLPKWVSRHKMAPGSVTANFGAGGVQSITVTNGASYDKKLQGRFEDAVKTRTGAITTKVRRILKGEAVNLGFTTKEATGITLAAYKTTPESTGCFTVDDST